MNRLWGREGSVEIKFLAPSVYMVNFPSKHVRDWVLESGPWHIQQKAIVLRKWLPEMIPEVLCLDSAPIWVRLRHIPLEIYTQQGLGYLASALGKPLYSDKATILKQSLEYAKICVEVSAKSSLPESILVDLGEGHSIHVSVELVWASPRCSHCSILGHSDETCSRKGGGLILASGETIQVVDNKQVMESVSVGEVVGIQQVVDNGFVSFVPVLETEIVDQKNGGDLNCSASASVIQKFQGLDDVVVCGDTTGGVVISDSHGQGDAPQAVVEGIPSLNAEICSLNKFEALCSVAVEHVVSIPSPRKERVAAAGVVDLLNQLKPKGKGGGPKNQKKQGKGKKGGHSPSL
ncbi:hypothetical protein V6N13_039702 [Hibiscus sabdariffa]|uniref:DUF4283 domain-containing protein n=1 Tax=Hibiscus sabdariffa TaxID=183260 RepID=A0ABR2SUR4_9ROSI